MQRGGGSRWGANVLGGRTGKESPMGFIAREKDCPSSARVGTTDEQRGWDVRDYRKTAELENPPK